jgi:L-2-hydroxycarboxylate dehydrogenase (NAD+)
LAVCASVKGAEQLNPEQVRVDPSVLEAFCRDIFHTQGLSMQHAREAAEVLVAADVRGIPSHGVARLERYVSALQMGIVDPDATTEVVRETASSILLNANGAMGAPVSVRAMSTVIDKARTAGAAFGAVRDSNHFGIAGYYAMMALDQEMIGLAMTNTAALGVPTFGRQVMFGTNPLAFAAPADRERAFVLDMSTTVVTRGKIEVYERLDRPLPQGWAVDRKGAPAQDASGVLDDMFERVGGGILPLGGLGERFGGHKGYGLAVMVDILCGVLAGGLFGADLEDTATSSGRVGHFFGAIRIDSFRDPGEFRRDMDRMLQGLRDAPRAEGAERIYFAGLKEFEHEAQCRRLGVPVLAQTYRQLQSLGQEHGLAVPPAIQGG